MTLSPVADVGYDLLARLAAEGWTVTVTPTDSGRRLRFAARRDGFARDEVVEVFADADGRGATMLARGCREVMAA